MRTNRGTTGALIQWTKGRPSFTAAGLRHYEAACAEAHLAFAPQSVRSAADLCMFLRQLLGASVRLRAEGHDDAARTEQSASSMQSLARRALSEVACDHQSSAAQPSEQPRERRRRALVAA